MPDILIGAIEARVLGALIEKSLTTPDYYPLTLNALVNACNQKSNRDPVMTLAETDVVRAVDVLRDIGLANKIYKTDSRVPKYEHYFGKRLDIMASEVAVMCELMLRGPQTVGELRGHGDRMFGFSGLEEVESLLQMLEAKGLVLKLPRQMGQKERRYAHLLGGVPEVADLDESMKQEPAAMRVMAENARIAALEAEIAGMKAELAEFKRDFETFKKGFE